MKRLEALISSLRNNGAMHIKRGYKMIDVTLSHQSNALIEEAVELQGEILDGIHKDNILKEASHVMSVFTHLMIRCGITMEQLEDKAISEVRANFTIDPDKITAKEVGFNRSARSENEQTVPETSSEKLSSGCKQVVCPQCYRVTTILEDFSGWITCDCNHHFEV